jgi:hypothetical protein
VNNALMLYWSANGTTTSSSEIVDGDVAFSAPSMILNSGGVDIAVQGQDNALGIYWQAEGSGNWDVGNVAAAGTTFSAPAMVLNGDGVDMTAAGPGGSLYDYWALNGDATWSAERVAPPGSVG